MAKEHIIETSNSANRNDLATKQTPIENHIFNHINPSENKNNKQVHNSAVVKVENAKQTLKHMDHNSFNAHLNVLIKNPEELTHVYNIAYSPKKNDLISSSGNAQQQAVAAAERYALNIEKEQTAKLSTNPKNRGTVQVREYTTNVKVGNKTIPEYVEVVETVSGNANEGIIQITNSTIIPGNVVSSGHQKTDGGLTSLQEQVIFNQPIETTYVYNINYGPNKNANKHQQAVVADAQHKVVNAVTKHQVNAAAQTLSQAKGSQSIINDAAKNQAKALAQQEAINAAQQQQISSINGAVKAQNYNSSITSESTGPLLTSNFTEQLNVLINHPLETTYIYNVNINDLEKNTGTSENKTTIISGKGLLGTTKTKRENNNSKEISQIINTWSPSDLNSLKVLLKGLKNLNGNRPWIPYDLIVLRKWFSTHKHTWIISKLSDLDELEAYFKTK